MVAKYTVSHPENTKRYMQYKQFYDARRYILVPSQLQLQVTNTVHEYAENKPNFKNK